MTRWFLGPVFVFECTLVARRWQIYAGRTAFLGALFVSLAAVWVARLAEHQGTLNRNALAAVGAAFFAAIAGTQLVLALLAAPAYAAASICLDKACGTLTHLLVTDLSAAEIVVGKLAARALPVFGLLLTSVPILVLATFLGGVDPEAVIRCFFVTLAVALVGCTLAVALSVWATKPHEVLLGAYFVETVWVLAESLWSELFGPVHAWVKVMNPFTLVFSTQAEFGDCVLFGAVCCGLSTAFILFAVLTLCRAARRDGARKARHWRFPRLIPFTPSLDFNPVLWREWRRRLPSRWLQVIWGLYALLAVGTSATALVMAANRNAGLVAFVNAFQFSIGLLLVCVTSVASLFEERANGSLDVLMTTPLSAASIVRGKWLASFRMVVLVMLVPALLACSLALVKGGDHNASGLTLLLIVLMFSYGAMVNSLGLALATWVPRFGAAMGLAVAIYVVLAAGPVLLLLIGPERDDTWREFASLSAWYGVGETTVNILHERVNENVGWKFFWAASYSLTAFALAFATQQTFDRCIGRARVRR